jgi:uncharacterized protein involved in exopolysaccharide biosynthesis
LRSKVAETGAKTQIETRTTEIVVSPITPDGQEILIRENVVVWLRLVWNERHLVTRATLAGLVIGLLLAFFLPKRFESTAQLMPPDTQASSNMVMLAALSSRTGGGLGALAGDLLGIKSSGALFIGILRSRTVEDRLVDRFDLKKEYWTRLDETARRKLAENTMIIEDRKSGIITITVSDRDPLRAAAMARGYVEELDRLVAKVSTSSARREREFLEGRLNSVQSDLESAEKDFSQFASKNSAIDIKEQGRAMLEAAATLEGHLIAAKSELEGLKQIYSDNNVRVRAASARVFELQGQLDKIGGKGESTSSADGINGDPLYPSIRKLPLLGVTYADLYRRTKVQEAVFEALTQQYELAKVQEAKETPSVKILDEPRVPERRSFPPRLLIMTLSTMLAMVMAALFILARASWAAVDQADPGKVLAMEVFQTVNTRMPWAPPNGSRVQAATHRVWTRIVRRNASTDRESGLN